MMAECQKFQNVVGVVKITPNVSVLVDASLHAPIIKFEKVLKNSKPHFLKFDTNDCIEICDNFAIKFAEWLVIRYNEDIIFDEYTSKELLEIYKKEKGL